VNRKKAPPFLLLCLACKKHIEKRLKSLEWIASSICSRDFFVLWVHQTAYSEITGQKRKDRKKGQRRTG
jgi:hypothetical protein